MDTFGQFLYIQRDVEDVKNFTKYNKITLLIDGGSIPIDIKGRLIFLPLSVHANKNVLATVISLKDLNNVAGVCVTMDKFMAKAMNVILSDGTFFKVKECGSRLFYYDIENIDEKNCAKTMKNYPLIPVINCNQE